MDKKLVLQFSDWTALDEYQNASSKNYFRREGDCVVFEATTRHPAGPAVMTHGGFATKEKHFNPGLSGINIFEINFADYTYSGDFLNKYWSCDGGLSKVEDPIVGRYLMGWGIAIGNYPGFVGSKKGRSRNRAVQFHFDQLSKIGLYSYLNRAIIPDDKKKYPRFDHKQFSKIQVGGGDDAPLEPWRARDDCTVLEVRHHPVGTKGDSGIKGSSSGHRYGIKFSDDGNKISWMLDGKIMGTYDITGYFSSSPGIIDDGLYISVCFGGSYQRSVWKFNDAHIYITK